MSETVGETVKKNRPGTFSKESPRPGPGRGKKKPKLPAGIDVFADMKKAYETPESPDDSPMVKKFREQAHDNPELFIKNFFRTMGAGGGEVESAGVEAAASAKEERIEELADRLLSEWETEDAGVGGKK